MNVGISIWGFEGVKWSSGDERVKKGISGMCKDKSAEGVRSYECGRLGLSFDVHNYVANLCLCM